MSEVVARILSVALPILGAVVALVVLALLGKACYKIAPADKVLIITGGKEPRYIVAGGAFVIPIIRQAEFFDLCILTITAGDDRIMTHTGVEIKLPWTAQVRPVVDDTAKLAKAIRSFNERKKEDMINDIKYTLLGVVRSVVATMSPDQVLRDKETFKKLVLEGVEDEISGMGLEVVALNPQDVDDVEGGSYFRDLAAADRENRRKEAEIITAQADQEVREKQAESKRIASQAELDSDLAIAERTRDTEVQKAGYKAETDKAQADAEVAGKLRSAEREKELATNQGQVEVERQLQANLAAERERDVILTRADAEKKKVVIQAEASAERNKIEAEAQAMVAQTSADGKAKAAKIEADGKAEAIKLEAAAEADRVQKTGSAEADIIRQRGLAEAESIKARGLAEAESERALAEARAANDKVNFEITKMEIESEMRVKIATSVAEVVASVGEKAQFIDLGGSKGSEGDLLTRVLGNVPSLMKKLGVENQALNGEPLNDTIQQLVSSFVNPLGVLNKETRFVDAGSSDTSDTSSAGDGAESQDDGVKTDPEE